ncbi:tRNA pseudouridine synthase B [Pyrenophora tritici-repentis Pt-1C-BFP]|uniref:tRNA pseudouridine(55) synthase n=1 Tax=Pyrenophora tritici-repentis (strain Pt-1C-BFP) TaxID=426418 RepID=B2W7I6_PYRTR|nr:tRNA pseudouridine synthase B [Pyrenophora tritici-repentis Pt-1C-BFP]EDU48694.1 tRNA pseudouridine synthase B [Pyrenophora tritici-repentis Pt-1C-BFP]
MATSTKSNPKVLEGIFAINKPQWASSAGVLRDLQEHFSRSSLFAPWLESQKRSLILSQAKQKHINNLKVKLGHGGTLDPMATGVLIVGMGKGTKCLQRFLECTKTYECVVLFGAATDSYDAVGKVVSKAPYEHVTKELVEERLAQFRGKILQKPSVFSALKVDGKKMYEYARAGGDIPEVAARPVEVEELELVEWLEPGSHEFAWPKEEVGGEEMEGAKKLMGIRAEDAKKYADTTARKGRKRERSPESDSVEGAGKQPKMPKSDTEPAMSGALPSEEIPVETAEEETSEPPNDSTTEPVDPVPTSTEPTDPAPPPAESEPHPQPPAARLRMTVTSGFYVRSLCHDLGLACSSLGLMSSLIRSRQGAYTLNKNVLEYSDLEDPAKWEPVLQKQLEDFMQEEGWEAEELEDEEKWEAKKKGRLAEEREEDRERSYRGGGRNKWNKGKGKYSRGGGGGRRD